jgi:tetratricopeptide (TPR) repeat protein
LRELRWEKPNINEALEELLTQVDARSSTRDLLAAVYTRRTSKLGKREVAILGLLAVSPIPLGHDTLCHAAELELSSSVIPKEGTESAIDHSLEFLKEQRLIRQQSLGYVIAQEPIRQLIIDGMTERDEARYCGKIADVLVSSKDAGHAERFEFERRSGRIGPALEFAMLAAEEAEVRYAYHRSAKIWRWILEHEAQLPEYELVRPTSELARVEHLAGRHGRAAELFHQASHVKPHKRMLSKLEEAQAWMQANQINAAQIALHEGLLEAGRGYESRRLERWFAGLALWSRGGDGFNEKQIPSATASPAQLAEARLLNFALEWSDWLDPRMSEVLEWRLSRLARESGDPVIVGMSRLQTALGEVKTFRPMSVSRALQNIAQARQFFGAAQAESWVAQSYVVQGWIHLQDQAYADAMKAFEQAEFEAEGVENSTGFDDRLLQAWKGLAYLRQGAFDDAEHTARHLLHIHRGDGVARALAAELLTEVALYRGETSRAERMLDILSSIEFPCGCVQEIHIARLNARLQLALGQPEVAVAQIDMLLEAPTSARWKSVPTQYLQVKLALGQAIAANATRQKGLGEGQLGASLERLRKIVRQVTRIQGDVDKRTQLEIIRLAARLELLRDQPRKALRMIGTVNVDSLNCDTLTRASMREARGVILNRMDKGEGKSEQEQAREVYEQQRCFYPLVFEGWPIPRSLMTLKED